jgi:hypothetical protein
LSSMRQFYWNSEPRPPVNFGEFDTGEVRRIHLPKLFGKY